MSIASVIKVIGEIISIAAVAASAIAFMLKMKNNDDVSYQQSNYNQSAYYQQYEPNPTPVYPNPSTPVQPQQVHQVQTHHMPIHNQMSPELRWKDNTNNGIYNIPTNVPVTNGYNVNMGNTVPTFNFGCGLNNYGYGYNSPIDYTAYHYMNSNNVKRHDDSCLWRNDVEWGKSNNNNVMGSRGTFTHEQQMNIDTQKEHDGVVPMFTKPDWFQPVSA